jgi:hypothetical protein
VQSAKRLVATRLHGSTHSVIHPSMGHRVWFAWQCLPRDDRGDPPPWRALEVKHRLANATIHKLCWGVTQRPSYETIVGTAQALGTTAEWLQYERGEGPSSRWPVVPRPEAPPVAAKRTKRAKSGRLKAVR